MEQFIEQLKEVLEMEDIEISADTKFRELEDWDSLSDLSVLAFINDEYDSLINRNEFEKIQTIKELYMLIKK